MVFIVAPRTNNVGGGASGHPSKSKQFAGQTGASATIPKEIMGLQNLLAVVREN
jgi:hypothetical protein